MILNVYSAGAWAGPPITFTQQTVLIVVSANSSGLARNGDTLGAYAAPGAGSVAGAVVLLVVDPSRPS